MRPIEEFNTHVWTCAVVLRVELSEDQLRVHVGVALAKFNLHLRLSRGCPPSVAL